MEANKLIHIFNRVYSDFLMPSRLGEYCSFLEDAISRGYAIHSVSSFWELIKRGEVDNDGHYLILRHDIDTSIKTAKRMWLIEKKLGIAGSFYFRLSTIDIELMKEIAERGGEAGYHFEEIATFSKDNGLASENDVRASLPAIRTMFKQNLLRLREKTQLPILIVASHGDFINRKLGMKNCLLLDDPLFRKEMKINLEVYDEIFIDNLKAKYSDTHYPLFWKPSHPSEAIRLGLQTVYILIHPRHWQTDRSVNARDDLNRAFESITYGLRKLRNSYDKFHSITKESDAL